MRTELTQWPEVPPSYHDLRTSTAGRESLITSGRTSPEAMAHYVESIGRHNGGRPTHTPKYVNRQFVGWDGEGITDDSGEHRYVLLANSTGAELINPDGIETGEAFRFLLDEAQRLPHAVHVIFAGSYDANMILKSRLSRRQAKKLAEDTWLNLTVDTAYQIRYRPRHEFRLRQVTRPTPDTIRTVRSITLWDVWGSFQGSFVSACHRLLPLKDLKDLDLITDMKAKRGSFAADDLDDMRRYCQAELRALVRLVTLDCENFEAAGFRSQRFDGAGAKASVVLRAEGVKAHMRKDYPRPIDRKALSASLFAYAGGRVESFRIGHYRGPCYTVDLRSAYPWAATFLPSLKAGQWRKGKTDGPESVDEFSLWRVRFLKNSDQDWNHLFPFFYRAVDGSIGFPSDCESWYWAPEVFTAQRHCTNGRIEILGGLRYFPKTGERPFAFVPGLYRRRRLLEESSKGKGQPLKLALNSLYGKLAQQLGSKNGKIPPYHQIEWAGWITSKVRAEMYRLGINNEANLVSISTDGITFTGEPSTEIMAREGTDLGQYEIKRNLEGVFVSSGIYWLRDSEGWTVFRSRGIPNTSMAEYRETFIQRYRDHDYRKVAIPNTAFRGLVTSSLSDERWQDWCRWVTEVKELRPFPWEGKRQHFDRKTMLAVSGCAGCTTGEGLHETYAVGGGVSTCHALSWRDNLPSSVEGRHAYELESWDSD
jgi:hypothetical protein